MLCLLLLPDLIAVKVIIVTVPRISIRISPFREHVDLGNVAAGTVAHRRRSLDNLRHHVLHVCILLLLNLVLVLTI